jgi:LacI family transcriptional regulator
MGASAMEKLLAVIRGDEVEKLTKVAPQLILRASTQAR